MIPSHLITLFGLSLWLYNVYITVEPCYFELSAETKNSSKLR